MRTMTRLVRVRFPAAIAIVVATGWLGSPPAFGQALYGSIVGTVTDAQGAVAPGVVLTATNTGTELKVEVTSEADGSYAFRNLLPGTYTVLPGFREHQEKNIPVGAGNPVRINIKLEL